MSNGQTNRETIKRFANCYLNSCYLNPHASTTDAYKGQAESTSDEKDTLTYIQQRDVGILVT